MAALLLSRTLPKVHHPLHCCLTESDGLNFIHYLLYSVCCWVCPHLQRHLDIRKHGEVNGMWIIWMWTFMNEKPEMSFFFSCWCTHWKKSPTTISHENCGHWNNPAIEKYEMNTTATSRIWTGAVLNTKNSVLENDCNLSVFEVKHKTHLLGIAPWCL